MFYSTHSSEERLRIWRNFRRNFSGDLPHLVKEFATTKIQPRYLDYYTPNSWPNIFEIVSEGLFCQSGLTLVITGTMLYHNFIKDQNLQFDVISNHITGYDGLVLVHDEKYYNFLPGEIATSDFVKQNSTVFDRHIIASDKLFS